MNKVVFVISLLILFNRCNQAPNEVKDHQPLTNLETTPKITATDFDSIFNHYNAYGSFLLYDLNANRYYTHNEARVDSAFIPASTFKIPNSLIVLEEGAVKDENEMIPWDGVKRMAKMWNKDHNLQMAMRNSAYWFYQETARRVGEERMQYWIDTLAYGNQNINGGIDQFWLVGDLRISAREQVAFLRKLYDNNLPFSQRTKDIVRAILIREQTKDFTLHAKTGWGVPPNEAPIGWYVGYLKTEKEVYFFAMNMVLEKMENAKKRQLITKAVFKKLGIEIEGI